MTDAADIRERHTGVEHYYDASGEWVRECHHDHQPWPCDTARVLDEWAEADRDVRYLRERADKAEAGLDACIETGQRNVALAQGHANDAANDADAARKDADDLADALRDAASENHLAGDVTDHWHAPEGEWVRMPFESCTDVFCVAARAALAAHRALKS